MTGRQRFILAFDERDVPAVIRLRRVLKLLGRQFGYRVRSIAVADNDQLQPPASPANIYRPLSGAKD